MARQRKTYTREFKIEAVQLLKRSGRTQEDLEQELGLASGTLSRWKKLYSEDGAEAFPGRGRLWPPTRPASGSWNARTRSCGRSATS